MNLTETQQKFFEFVKAQHGPQVRKYTGDPYHVHLLAVATTFSPCANLPGEIEGALGHDLYEDTKCSRLDLFEFMASVGYDFGIIERTDIIIRELTDVYTKDAYPDLNRKTRKKLEAQRLGQISFAAKSIKYADLTDNTISIVEHDATFAPVYVTEKEQIMWYMQGGNPALRDLCIDTLKKAKKQLNL